MKHAMVIITALLLSGCGGATPAGGGSSSASCVLPQLSATPLTAARGEQVQVSGRYFVTGCQDTVVNGVPQGDLPRPQKDLSLALRQGDRSWPLAEHLDAALPDWSFETSVTLPDDVAPGPALLVVPGIASPLALTVR